MEQRDLARVTPRSDAHHAGFALKLGERASMVAEANITSGGMLSVAALVSAALLGSAAIVWAARRSR
jgi:hypothetical protein